METVPNIKLPAGWEGDPKYASAHGNMADSYINKEKGICINVYTHVNEPNEAELEINTPQGWLPVSNANVTTVEELQEVIKLADK